MTTNFSELSVFVQGLPIEQGSMNTSKSGHMYSAKSGVLKPWRKKIAAALDKEAVVCGWEYDRDAALAMRLVFWMPRPRTVKRSRPSVVPDADKLTRAVGDACTMSSVIFDDSRFVHLEVDEFYADADNPIGLRLEMWRLE